MGGVKIGDDFVSSEAAWQEILAFIEYAVGTRNRQNTKRSPGRNKPELLFAIDVIKKTIPKKVLTGNRLDVYEQSVDILFDIRDALVEVRDHDDFTKNVIVRQEFVGFIRRMVGPKISPRTGKSVKPRLLFAISMIKKTIPMNVLRGEKRDEFDRALGALFGIRDEMSQMETIICMFWPDEDE